MCLKDIRDPADSMLKATQSRTGKWAAENAVGKANTALLAGPTAAQFDRTNKHRLYITTIGGIARPPAGGPVSGKLFAFGTSKAWTGKD